MKQLFDCFPPRRASIMRLYFAGYIQSHGVEVMGDAETITGIEIFQLTEMAVGEMCRVFSVEPQPLLDEIYDYYDATIWANLHGGINDPVHGKDNPYWENRQATND